MFVCVCNLTNSVYALRNTYHNYSRSSNMSRKIIFPKQKYSIHIHAGIHASIHICILIRIHKYIRICIHTYIHTLCIDIV